MSDSVREFLQTPVAQTIIMVSVLAIVAMFGYYIVLKFRNWPDDRPPSASDMLSNFREWHDEGDIDDQEFRSIKNIMGKRLHRELDSPPEKTQDGFPEENSPEQIFQEIDPTGFSEDGSPKDGFPENDSRENDFPNKE